MYGVVIHAKHHGMVRGRCFSRMLSCYYLNAASHQ